MSKRKQYTAEFKREAVRLMSKLTGRVENRLSACYGAMRPCKNRGKPTLFDLLITSRVNQERVLRERPLGTRLGFSCALSILFVPPR